MSTSIVSVVILPLKSSALFYNKSELPYSALRTASVHTYLAGEFIVEEDVPGSKVSVDKAFLGKVAHAISDVLRELDKH